MVVNKRYWVLTAAEHEQHAAAFCERLKRDLVSQYKKGATKRGEVNLFTDEREFGYIPQGSEPYWELVDTFNYATIFGTEKKRRHDNVRRGHDQGPGEKS